MMTFEKIKRARRAGVLSVAAFSLAASVALAPVAHAEGVITIFGPGNSGAALGTASGDQPECAGEAFRQFARTNAPRGQTEDQGQTTTDRVSLIFFFGAVLPNNVLDCADLPGPG